MADNDINQHGKQNGNHSQDIRFGNIDAIMIDAKSSLTSSSSSSSSELVINNLEPNHKTNHILSQYVC
ncbi:hypothetical protein DERP_011361 [Dermatophagoides pteronyssinus]|uniref:Uncharacterized protein n=1 Tax=Dermatophagoides pteronyssinus TaxID=6956 RepID=A0ABQ8J7D0_DERPT|nr:hypothetical protein DERP_011361 [Dermatophagoides pteronyssinus]